MRGTSTPKSIYVKAVTRSLNSTSKLIAALAVVLILGIARSNAQAPNISYSSPQVYNPFIPITLSPTNTGGVVPLPVPVYLTQVSTILCMTVDNAKSFYLGTSGSGVITKITGNVKVSIGSGFVNPSGIAVDPQGNVFVADYGHNEIKEIVAGSGKTNVLLSAASPKGMAIDASGAIYFCIGTTVCKLPAGATNRVTVATGFSVPTSVTLDAAGNVYVADQGPGTITKVLASNHSKVILASGIAGVTGVAVDKYNNVYYSASSSGNPPIMIIPAYGGPAFPVCASSFNHNVVAVDNDANVYTNKGGTVYRLPFGTYTISQALPAGLTFDTTTGIISGYPLQITPATNYTVTAYNNQGKSATVVNIAVSASEKPYISYNTPQYSTVNTPVSFSVVNTGGVVPTQHLYTLETSLYSKISGLAIDASGNIYAATHSNTLVKYPAGGGAQLATYTGFVNTAGVVVDAAGNIFVLDNGKKEIDEILAINGSVITYATGFLFPQGIAIDAAGNLYVTDSSRKCIYKVPAGGGTPVILINGLGSPFGIAADPAGNVYFADKTANTITELPVGGGTPLVLASGLNTPIWLAADPGGNVFFLSAGGKTGVQRITAGGGAPVNVASIIPVVAPAGIALDAKGNIYTSDLTNGTIVEANPGYYVNPNLPAGLSINQNTGLISGTPTATSPKTNYSVSARNSGGVSVATIEITISQPPPPVISYMSPQVYAENNIVAPLAPVTNIGQYVNTVNATTFVSGLANCSATATDVAGNVYFTNGANGQILKIPATGGAATPVGGGKIYSAIALVLDAAGNIYYVSGGSEVFIIRPDGSTATFQEGFINLIGIGIDAGNNLYVLDGVNQHVVKIPAGNGTPVLLQDFSHSTYRTTAITADRNGNVFVAASFNGTGPIYKINTSNQLSTLPANATYYSNMTTDQGGNLYFSIGGVIVEVTPAGTTQQIYSAAGAFFPAVDGAGNLFLSNQNNGTILKCTRQTGFYINGILPAGLTFDGTTGVIGGTPTAVSPATDYTVTGYTPTANASATVNIATVAGTNNSLTGLALSSGTLSPAFATATTSYTVSVPNSTSSVSVTPTAGDGTAVIRVNGVTVASGAASAAIPLAVGVNTIGVNVTDNGGTTASNYTVVVTRAGNPNLASLTVNSGTLSPAFSPGTYSYSVTMPAGVGSISITPTLADTTGTISINQKGIATGTASPNIQLALGANNISVVTTTTDGLTATYTINAIRLSANANLSAIAFSKGSVSPAFSANALNYTMAVANTVTSVTVTPTTSDAYATVKVNGTAVTSGSPSAAIALSVGANTITVAVTAPDGSATKTYTFTVNRAGNNNANLSSIVVSAGALAPAFAPTATAYTVNVVNGVTSIKVTPTVSDADATITVNSTAVASGSASAPIALSLGANTITIAVTASNGTTVKNYTITVNRAKSNNANLAGFAINQGTLTPAFSPGTTSYTASVANSVTSMTVVPTSAESTATIKVNGSTVASGTVSQNLPLAVGANTISTVLTAGDGTTTKTYTLTVTRAAGPVNIPDESVAVAALIEKPAIEDDVILVHQGISPNGDGINDYFVIDGIQAYPDNKLMIMNRNGGLVFEAKGYDNASKVFDGRSNKTGQLQLPGTYFYSLEYTAKGIIKHKTGFVVLKY